MNFEAFQSLVKNLFELLMSSSLNEVSVPNLLAAVQYLIASAPYFSIKVLGSEAELFLDLDNFSPFLARTKPLIIKSFQGSSPV